MKNLLKIGLVAALAFAGYKYLNSGSSTPTSTNELTDGLEGKWVVAENGNHFIILNGKRWYTANGQAIQDFQKAYPGNDSPIENVSEAELSAYPISGSIWENLELRAA